MSFIIHILIGLVFFFLCFYLAKMHKKIEWFKNISRSIHAKKFETPVVFLRNFASTIEIPFEVKGTIKKVQPCLITYETLSLLHRFYVVEKIVLQSVEEFSFYLKYPLQFHEIHNLEVALFKELRVKVTLHFKNEKKERNKE